MVKLEVIQMLEQCWDSIKALKIDFDSKLSELKDKVMPDTIISSELCEDIQQQLLLLCEKQKEFAAQYACLEMGPLPEKTEKVSEVLQQCRIRYENLKKYVDAVNFFQSLHSKQETTQTLLDRRKGILSGYDLENMKEDAIEKFLWQYVQLHQAFLEKNLENRFSLLYKLAPYFEEEIARGIQFETFDFNGGIDIETVQELIVEESISQDLEISTIEECVSIEDKETFVDEKSEDANTEEEAVEITENFDDLKEVEMVCTVSDEVNQQIEAIRIIEQRELLTVEMSPKANVKFGAKEFKSDIKQLPIPKIQCLSNASTSCGYSRTSIALWEGKEIGYYDTVTEKMFQLGYLKKYAVNGYGEFYTLSFRGEKAFASKELNHVMHNFLPKTKCIDVGEYIEDSTNSALTRLLCTNSMSKVLRINDNYKFMTRSCQVRKECFVMEYPKVLQDKKLTFLGIVSDDLEQFDLLQECVKEINKDAQQYIIIGLNQEHAYGVAQWIKKSSATELPVWYCSYFDDTIYDLQTMAPIVLEEEKSYTDTNDDAEIIEDVILEETISEKETSEEMMLEETVPGETIPEGTASDESVSVEAVSDEIVSESDSMEGIPVEEEGVFGEEDVVSDEVQMETDMEDMFSEEELLDDTFQEETTEDIIEKIDGTLDAIENVLHEVATTVEHVDNETDTELEHGDYDSICMRLLADGKFFAAMAYLKAIANKIPKCETKYRQLAYALNDPMEYCTYNSANVFSVYYDEEAPISDYFVIAASIRNYFLNQFSYDYSLQQLQATLTATNQILADDSVLNKIVYTLFQFKNTHYNGIDKYADYREIDNIVWGQNLEQVRREAKQYYETYCTGNLKESVSHRRYVETIKILFSPGSDLSEYLQLVIRDDRDAVDILEEFLTEQCVKPQALVSEENIDPEKIHKMLDYYWDMAAEKMNSVKKTSDLMSSLRMNLFKRVHKVMSVLCSYVFLVKTSKVNEDDAAFVAYRKLKNTLLQDIQDGKAHLMNSSEMLYERAGRKVLLETLEDIEARLLGTYKKGKQKYFYLDFLKADKVLLDENFMPVLEEVLELPELSVENRILEHCKCEESDWETRLNHIFTGGDNYGSAELILEYLENQQDTAFSANKDRFNIQEAIVFPLEDIENKKKEFIEDIELAQSYGQIDNTVENRKDIIIQVADTWYSWAIETKNYGFFIRILDEFRKKIRKDALVRAVELEKNLKVYLKTEVKWKENSAICKVVEQILERIQEQNYAAAEDLLNRLIMNDFDNSEIDFLQKDYLQEFLNEYDTNYKKSADSGVTLKSLLSGSIKNKDTKGANKLLESWPKGANVTETSLKSLLATLGFEIDTVSAQPLIQNKINFVVNLKRPKNGRKSNYKHPISAFGSEAEEMGFRVVYIFGKADTSRLIDIFKEIGNAKHTLIILDYALALADRKTLARKTKTDMTGKVFAVIDRVVLTYLARHYVDTSINRMLMSVIMPFASYQPYVNKSADIMPQEIFIGRKNELEKIESPKGINILYGGRQLGKTALLRMAKKNIDRDEFGNRAVLVNVWKKDYKASAKAVSEALYDEGVLKENKITEDWDELAHAIKNRLRDDTDKIPYLLLLIDEADTFIESCEDVEFAPFNALKDIQSVGEGRFKFVIAGLRNIVRFKRNIALQDNNVLVHLESLTVKPFKAMEARELLEVPLSYLGFRFPKDNETEVLISTIFGTTNYFPGLIQLYCTKLIEAMARDYAGYSESETPPYYIRKEHIKKVLAEQSLQEDIRQKFFITLKVGDDVFYYVIALLVAFHYHQDKTQNGCSAKDLLHLAQNFEISKLSAMKTEELEALMEEMRELNVLQYAGEGRYRFTRHSFCQMMGTMETIEEELLQYMGD